MGGVVGIDLGTTNTVVATMREGRVHVLADDEGHRLLPSVVSFHPNGEVLVGRAAKQRRAVDGKNTISSFKRLLGQSWGSEEIDRARMRFPFELREGPETGVLVVARGQEYTLSEIGAFVLKRVKQIAEAAMGEPVDRAVITVPAHFNELQRTATKVAGRVAGLEVLRILNEPTAAALAYGLTARHEHERTCVYDFGGGTFDCTILDLSGDVFEVLATAGDTFLGGDDVDGAIAERMSEAFLRLHRWDPRTDRQAFERLRLAAERVKVDLTRRSETVIQIRELTYGVGGKNLDLSFPFSRPELDALLAPLVDRTFAVTQDAMSAAGQTFTSVDRVVLVGGSTRSPFVKQRVTEFFGVPPLDRVNPDEVVAIGAAIQAATLADETRVRNVPRPPVPQRARALSRSGEPQQDRSVTLDAPSPSPGASPGGVSTLRNFGEEPSLGLPHSAAVVQQARRDDDPSITRSRDTAPIRGAAPTIDDRSIATKSIASAVTSSLPPGASGPPPYRGTEPPSVPPSMPSLASFPSNPTSNVHTQRSNAAFEVPEDEAETDWGKSPRSTSVPPPLPPRRPPPPKTPTSPPLPPGQFGSLPADPFGSMPPQMYQPSIPPPQPAFAPPHPFSSLPEPSSSLADFPHAHAGRDRRAPGADGELPSSLLPPSSALPQAPFPPPGAAPAPDYGNIALTRASYASSPLAGPPPAKAPTSPPLEIDRGGFGPTGETVPGGAPVYGTQGAQPLHTHDAPLPGLPPARPPQTALSFGQPNGYLHQQQQQQRPFESGAPPILHQGADVRRSALPNAGQPVLVHVTPRALVVETVGGYCDVVLPRNAKIPCERTRRFATSSDNQTSVRVRVAQGERTQFVRNVLLGEIELVGLRPANRGEVVIAVTFELDPGGNLKVRATDVASGMEAHALLQLIAVADDEPSIASMIKRLAAIPVSSKNP